jgi:uncharacterized RDD family membrane protein YckC
MLFDAAWAIRCVDSPGKRRMGLRMVTFDATPLDRRQRLVRVAAKWLCVGGGGWGILWALVDEEGLALHDHISQSYPGEWATAIEHLDAGWNC